MLSFCKTFTITFILLNLSLFIIPANSGMIRNLDDRPREGCAWLYELCDFKGQMVEVCKNENNLGSLNFDKKISSLKIGINTKIFLFTSLYFQGNSQSLTNDMNCLSSGEDSSLKQMDNQASSVMIYTPLPSDNCILLLSSCDFSTGRKKEFCSDVNDVTDLDFRVAAIILGKGVNNAILYKDLRYRGDSYVFNNDICLNKSDDPFLKSFSFQTSSLRIFTCRKQF
jgi:hypothetical protein